MNLKLFYKWDRRKLMEYKLDVLFYMKGKVVSYFQIFFQSCLILLFSIYAHANSSCFEMVKELKKKRAQSI